MNLIPRGNRNYDDALIEVFEAEGGLTLEKIANYITETINSGFVFESGRITSRSDKDNWTNFSGRSNYTEYNALIKTLQSDILKSEEGVAVFIDGLSNGISKQISFDVEDSVVKFCTPARKISQDDPAVAMRK